MMELISICIPTMNRGHLFTKTVESALKQTYQNKEIIISDNASSDATQKIGLELARLNKEVKYIKHEKTLAQNDHWQKILKNHVSGKYVIFIPDDDIFIDKDYIKRSLYRLDNSNDIVLIFGNYIRVGLEEKEIITNLKNFDLVENLFMKLKSNLYNVEGLGVPQLTGIFERELALKCGGFKYKCTSPDFLFWMDYIYKSSNQNKKYYLDSSVVSAYLVQEESLSNTKTNFQIFSDAIFTAKFCLKVLFDFLKAPSLLKFKFIYKSIQLSYWFWKRSIKRKVDLLKIK